MFLAGHAAAGALIGQQLQENAILIFFLAFVSHFLLDIIPHGDHHNVVDYYFGKKEKLKEIYNIIKIDAVATVIMVVVLLVYTNLNKMAIAWGVIGGILPDLLVGLNEIVRNSWIKKFSNFHFKIHNALINSIDVKPLPGTVMQIIAISAMLVAL